MLKRIMIKRIIIKKSKCYNRYLLIQYGLIANPEERKIMEKSFATISFSCGFHVIFTKVWNEKVQCFKKSFDKYLFTQKSKHFRIFLAVINDNSEKPEGWVLV